MTKEEVKPLIEKAVDMLIKSKKLPIKLDEVTEKDHGIFILWFTDLKLLQKVDRITGQFVYTIFDSTYTDLSTNGIDLMANIPANASDNVRVILRIAFLIYNLYINNIREVYKKFAEPWIMVTQASAMEWYDKL